MDIIFLTLWNLNYAYNKVKFKAQIKAQIKARNNVVDDREYLLLLISRESINNPGRIG